MCVCVCVCPQLIEVAQRMNSELLESVKEATSVSCLASQLCR